MIDRARELMLINFLKLNLYVVEGCIHCKKSW